MDKLTTLRERIGELLDEDQRIRDYAIKHQGGDLTENDMDRIRFILDEAHMVEKQIYEEERRQINERLSESQDEVYRPDPNDGPGPIYQRGVTMEKSTAGSIGPKFRDLFPDVKVNAGKWGSFGEFAVAASIAGRTGNNHRELRAISEGVPAGGGFAVPTDYEAQMLDVALENEIVRPRARMWPMNSDTKKIPGTVIGDHSSNLYGGMVAYYKGEASALTTAEPQFRGIELNAWKLTAYGAMSNEWLEDKAIADGWLQEKCADVIGWFQDKNFLKGDGAGKPLGVFNAACLITVSAEGGQAASTIRYENLVNMLARLYPGSFNKSVWVCHVSTIPQLLTLTITAGTGGSHYKVLSETGGRWTMLTRIFTIGLTNMALRMGEDTFPP